MNRENIAKAYDCFNPSQQAKTRMLDNILCAADEPAFGKEAIVKNNVLKRTVCIAAVVAVFIAMTAVAYANGWFGLRNAGIGLQDETTGGEIISLQGFEKSSEFAACTEWHQYLAGYDTDGAILATIGNGETGLDYTHEAYGCYTQEMAAKLDEIAAKYSLKLLGEFETVDNDTDFFALAGVNSFYSSESDSATNMVYDRRVYPDGTAHMDGDLQLLTGSAWPHTITYQLERSMKGTFNTVTLNVGSFDSYSDWSYTTANGIPLILALSPEKGLIIADLDSCFVVINILNVAVPAQGELEGTYEYMGEADLKAFADCFDFSALS